MRLGRAVIDADVLIKLARLGIVDRLVSIFAEVHVPTAVRRETKLFGRRRRDPSVEKFKRKAISCTRWNRTVFLATLASLQAKSPKKTHEGESQAIAQAVLYSNPFVLTDDKEAHTAARALGLKVFSSVQLVRMISDPR